MNAGLTWAWGLWLRMLYSIPVKYAQMQPMWQPSLPDADVKKLFQKFESSAKHLNMHGHMFRGLEILADSTGNWSCLPLFNCLHDCLKAACHWKGASVFYASHVVQILEDAYRAAETFGIWLFLLNRYFFIVNALVRLNAINNSGKSRMKIVTKVQNSCTAFEKTAPLKTLEEPFAQKGSVIHL